jgi:hypothetical protein
LHVLSGNQQRFIHTRFNTIPAEVTFSLIDVHSGADLRNGTLRAFGDTCTTIYGTPVFIQEDFRHRFYAFRIVTPLAIERTPFEENGCSNTRTIMDSVSFDIEDYSFGH